MTDEPEVLTSDLPQLRVSALAWGPADGRLALCLHGYPDTARTWRYLGPMLAAAGYRVVAPFSRGYAPTAIPDDGDYHIGVLMYDALALHREARWGCRRGARRSRLGRYDRQCPCRACGFPVRGSGPSADAAAGPAELVHRVSAASWHFGPHAGPCHTKTLAHLVPPGIRRHRRPGPTVGRAARSRASHSGGLLLPPPMHGQLDGAIDVGLATISAEALPAGSRHKIISAAGHFMQLDQAATVAGLINDYAVTSGS